MGDCLRFSRGGYDDLLLPVDWNALLMNELQLQGCQMIAVENCDCREVQDLRFHHKDSFDRMLVAHASNRKLDIIITDEALENYGVRRIS